MAEKMNVSLDRKESLLRVFFSFATISVLGFILASKISPEVSENAHQFLDGLGAKKVIVLLLYGIFGLWICSHLDVVGNRLAGGHLDRSSALKLGFAGRAFTPCGTWTRRLRNRVWKTMKPSRKASLISMVLRASRTAYIFGLVTSFFLINLMFPEFMMYHTGFEEGFVRLMFTVLIGGTLLLVGQNNAGLFSIRCAAMAVVMIYNFVAAFAFYVVVFDWVAISFDQIIVCFVVAQVVTWGLRVPFMIGVLEVLLLAVCPAADIGALLAACAVFHLGFQGPAFVAAYWIAFAPNLAAPIMLPVRWAKA